MLATLEMVTSTGIRCPVFHGGTLHDFLDAAWEQRFERAVVIGDSNTLPLFGESAAAELEARGVSVLKLSFPAGEKNKTRETKARLEDAMLAAGIDRFACVLAVGGGIAMDVAGFVAATYMRGIPWMSIATTLLAQVDASLGGKTGVNTHHGKNMIGAFHQPRAVWLAFDALSSLAPEELKNGWAEAIKHAVLADAELFARIESWAGCPTRPFPEELLLRCVRIKAGVVGRDEHEQGPRRILNFGHTVGHALERATAHRIPHGRAVALGMAVEARLAERLCGFPAAESERLRKLLLGLGLLGGLPCSFEETVPSFALDKKSGDKTIFCALPRRIGEMDPGGGRYALAVTLDELEKAWSSVDGGTRCCA